MTDADGELRDAINSIKKQRDYHQMDEPEYVDNLLHLFHAEQKKLLERLPNNF